MTLPFVPHEILFAVEDTLAEAVEGEVRSVRSILRMFETSFRRLFLKFERFSSLRKSCHDRARRVRSAGRGGKTCGGIDESRILDATRAPRGRPGSARDRSPCAAKPRAIGFGIVLTAGVIASHKFPLSVRLSAL
jgi:hypothetical protein